MAINLWWDGDANERYWMEITDRVNLGDNLLAPTTAKGGRETFSYKLVDHVNEGDIVFHWWTRNQPPALVARSTVSGRSFRSRIRWAARGPYSAGQRTTAAYEAPLDNFVELDVPLSLDDLRLREAALMRIRDVLQAKIGGPIYFPWVFSAKRPLRTTQGYLVKLPAAVVRELGLLGINSEEGPPDKDDENGHPTVSGSGGRQQDSELRQATEKYAVKLASEYFEALGCKVEDVGAKRSYDLHVVDQDGNEVHVEVKGSTTRAIAIELTAGEVKHWHPDFERALVVVDEIKWDRKVPGYMLTGGRSRIWRNWQIDKQGGQLMPMRYRYTLTDTDAETCD